MRRGNVLRRFCEHTSTIRVLTADGSGTAWERLICKDCGKPLSRWTVQGGES